MKIDLDEHERAAKAATPGPWKAGGHLSRVAEYSRGFAIVTADGVLQVADAYDNTPYPDAQCLANALHIAANGPPVALALGARIRELEVSLRTACDHIDDLNLPDPGLRAESVRLRAVAEKGVVVDEV